MHEHGIEDIRARVEERFALIRPTFTGVDLALFEDIKAASMWMAQDIYRGDDHLIHSRIQAACMNHKGAPTRMPKDFVQQARAYLPLNQSATA